ncbi:hypothetical protein V5E97_10585 [Singulisphaera sp. Ch08]|uniref:Uncharacterized protein n=1 Tax=Singulisphaera sp. Ch08 TaxID=3120278 RepID=A0AAU7CMJ4_9BACT
MTDGLTPSHGNVDKAHKPTSESNGPPGNHLIPENEWVSVWPGSTIDWSSPYVPVQFYLELPFWLMMPAGTFDVVYKETLLKVSIVHGCDELHRSVRHSKSGVSTVFVACPDEDIPVPIQQVLDRSPDGTSVHTQRTTLIIQATVLQSVLERIQGSEIQISEALSYLRAMVIGHLPIVNVLITAYRRAAYDPFVQEVTEATAPIWYLRYQNHFIRVSVFPYEDQEHRLVLSSEQGEHQAVDLATGHEVVEFLALPETPGETILLDAWKYFYSGRYSDSVRGLVSALEVLLEAKYSNALRSHGDTEQEIQKKLRSSATKFTTRFNNYLHLTRRTIPGPMLSWVPYVNGTRLRAELNQTRKLRHMIVHEGYQMNPYSRGPMLRAVETMTWLFDWLEDDERSSKNRFKMCSIKCMLRGDVCFDVEYVAGGVRVVEHDKTPYLEEDSTPMASDLLWESHGRALFGAEKDFALFAKMSLACLLADDADVFAVLAGESSRVIQDIESLEPLPGVMPERFRCPFDGALTIVFLLELDGELELSHLKPVMVRLLQLRVEFKSQPVHAVCIVNHQQHLEPAYRESYRTLNAELNTLLVSCEVSLVFASDLTRYFTGARHKNWRLTPVRDGLKGVGYVTCNPPSSIYVGEVVKLFPRIGVLGVYVDAELALVVGDQVLVRSATGFESMTVESIRAETKDLKSVSKGLVGLKVVGDVKGISEGAFVFKVCTPDPLTVSPVGNWTSLPTQPLPE